MDIVCVPTFMEVEINHSQRTGMRLVVQRWDYDEVHNIASEPESDAAPVYWEDVHTNEAPSEPPSSPAF
jgi:Stage V sporulation protein S (SpoVS)